MADPKTIPQLTEKDIKRFWSKVKVAGPNECWLWQAGTRHNYGFFCAAQRLLVTHRVSWFLKNGQIPEGLYVLHNCPDGDNTLCCNANHLWLGTLDDNNQDMVKKGRYPVGGCHPARMHPEYLMRGEKNGSAKLKEVDIPKIRKMIKNGISYRKIAAEFHVNQKTIWNINKFKIWTHV